MNEARRFRGTLLRMASDIANGAGLDARWRNHDVGGQDGSKKVSELDACGPSGGTANAGCTCCASEKGRHADEPDRSLFVRDLYRQRRWDGRAQAAGKLRLRLSRL